MSAMARRDSVADAQVSFGREVYDTLEQLRGIWDDCGIVEDQRIQRNKQYFSNLRNLLDDMLTEEEEMRQKLKNAVVERSEQVDVLRAELKMDNCVDMAGATLLVRCTELKAEVERLRVEKKRRTESADELRAVDAALCKRLCKEVYYLPHGAVPSDEQLTSLEQHVQQMQRETKERLEEFGAARLDVNRLYKRMGKLASRDFEVAALVGAEDDFPLSAANMDTLAELVSQTREEYKAYLEQFERRAAEATRALEELWEKCHVAAADRTALPTIDEENVSEDIIKRYWAEATRLQRYYDERQVVLAKLDAWKALWDEKIRFEQHQNDSEIYRKICRGGNLQRLLKRDRDLQTKLLPAAEQEVADAARLWNGQHPSEPIVVGGSAPGDYMEHVKRDHNERKEQEKSEKMASRKQQLEVETRFGTPVPLKKRPPSPLRGATPDRTRTMAASRFGAGQPSIAATRSPISARLPPRPPLPRATPTGALKRKALADIAESRALHTPADDTLSVQSYKAFERDVHHREDLQSSLMRSPSSSAKARRL